MTKWWGQCLSGRLGEGALVWMQGPWTRVGASAWPSPGVDSPRVGWGRAQPRLERLQGKAKEHGPCSAQGPASITGHMPRRTRPSLHVPELVPRSVAWSMDAPRAKVGPNFRGPCPEGLHGKQLFSHKQEMSCPLNTRLSVPSLGQALRTSREQRTSPRHFLAMSHSSGGETDSQRTDGNGVPGDADHGMGRERDGESSNCLAKKGRRGRHRVTREGFKGWLCHPGVPKLVLGRGRTGKENPCVVGYTSRAGPRAQSERRGSAPGEWHQLSWRSRSCS